MIRASAALPLRARAVGLAATLAFLALGARPAAPAPPTARADAAFDQGHTALAIREYQAVLRQDPSNTRALFRLGQLHKAQPETALAYFERYARGEPADAWGHMAVGDTLAALKRVDEALAAYDRAARLRPRERDVAVGRARILERAGRLEAALGILEAWLAQNPRDAGCWRDLGRIQQRAGRLTEGRQSLARAQRLSPDKHTQARLTDVTRAAAPTLAPIIGTSSDSDANSLRRAGLDARIGALGLHSPGVRVEVRRASDGFLERTLLEGTLHDSWRPRASVSVDSEIGLTRLNADEADPATATTRVTGAVRLRYRASADALRLTAKLQRRMADYSLLMLSDHLMRTDGQLRIETPRRGRLGLRGQARVTWMHGDSDDNRRLSLLAGPTWALRPGVELAAHYVRSGYAHPSTVGYFSPRLSEVVEAASYIELEGDSPLRAELDLGAGVQRSAEHEMGVGPWKPTLRAWGLGAYRLAPGRELRLEVDAYSGQPSLEVSTAAGSWSSISASLSLVWAF